MYEREIDVLERLLVACHRREAVRLTCGLSSFGLALSASVIVSPVPRADPVMAFVELASVVIGGLLVLGATANLARALAVRRLPG